MSRSVLQRVVIYVIWSRKYMLPYLSASSGKRRSYFILRSGRCPPRSGEQNQTIRVYPEYKLFRRYLTFFINVYHEEPYIHYARIYIPPIIQTITQRSINVSRTACP